MLHHHNISLGENEKKKDLQYRNTLQCVYSATEHVRSGTLT